MISDYEAISARRKRDADARHASNTGGNGKSDEPCSPFETNGAAAPKDTDVDLDTLCFFTQQGEPVFPLAEGLKIPEKGSHGHTDATLDQKTIRHWLQTRPRANWGVVPRALPSGRHVFLLDLDIKRDADGTIMKDGVGFFQRWCQEHAVDFDVLMRGVTVQTAGGGFQLHLESLVPVSQGANLLGEKGDKTGVDTRTSKGYGLVPGSVVNGHPYTFVSKGERQVAPDVLVRALGIETPSEETSGAIPPMSAHMIERVTHYLLHEAEPAIEGQSGDCRTFLTACHCKDFGTDQPTTQALMWTLYNPRCVPPWTRADLNTKIASAYRSRQSTQGSASAEAAFEKLSPEEEAELSKSPTDGPLTPWLDILNRDYFVADDDSSVRVFCPAPNPGPADRLWKSYSFDDFRKRYQHIIRPIWNAKAGKILPTDIATAWLNHPQRREYMGGLVFAPAGDVRPDQFNTWRGFSLTPRAGEHPRMTAHIQEVLCAGNETYFAFFMGALATMYQFPGRPWNIVIGIRGPQGCGKGRAFVDHLTAHFGAHSAHLHNAAHLVGRFNAHLRDRVLIIVNEAFFAGDRQHHALIKGLATEETFVFEEKNRMPVQCKNVAHLIVTSNEDWMLPADNDDRRSFMLDARGTYCGKRSYFEALDREMREGGREALLHTFLTYDLTGFTLLDVPKTKALAEQKDRNLRGPIKWIRDALDLGQLGGTLLSEDTRTRIPKQTVTADYARDHRYDKYSLQSGAMSNALWKVFGDAIAEQRPKIKGEDGKWTNGPWEWSLAPLGQLRAAFERFYGQPVEWNRASTIDPFEG